MWQLNNNTPYAAERCWVRGYQGEEVWLVAVKATFSIDPESGETDIADEQPPVNLHPVYRGEPNKSSLLYPDDLIMEKSGTDILLNATAYAPEQQPVTELMVSAQVGNWQKSLKIIGDRHWEQVKKKLQATEPEPFETMPIIYEHTYGGFDATDPENKFYPANPVGRGFYPVENELLPNVLPHTAIEPKKIVQQVAGYGCIAANWEPRIEYVGTYGKQWQEQRMPLLPDDFNSQFFRCAPADQQCKGYLLGGEPVILANLTPAGYLEFTLPKLRFGFRTRFKDGIELHSGKLHSVIIEPDQLRVSLVYHSALPCHGRDDKLDYTTIYTKEWV